MEMPNHNPVLWGALAAAARTDTVDAEADLLPSNDIKLFMGWRAVRVLNRLDGRFPMMMLSSSSWSATRRACFTTAATDVPTPVFSLSVIWIDPRNIHFRLTAILHTVDGRGEAGVYWRVAASCRFFNPPERRSMHGDHVLRQVCQGAPPSSVTQLARVS